MGGGFREIIMVLKKNLKGRPERIEEDKTWREKRVDWLLQGKAWEEKAMRKEVRFGKECIWVNGVKWWVDEERGEVVCERREMDFVAAEVVQRGDKQKGIKIGFWNVGGIESKEEGFWKGIKKWDIVFLCEIWVERRKWERIRRVLPKGYKWEMQGAEKVHKKGRSAGGMITGVRKEIREDKKRKRSSSKDGCMVRTISIGGEMVDIVGIYRRRGEVEG